jgi:hypothetical protein
MLGGGDDAQRIVTFPRFSGYFTYLHRNPTDPIFQLSEDRVKVEGLLKEVPSTTINRVERFTQVVQKLKNK